MKRLFVLLSCAASLSAFASSEPVKPKAVWVPASATVVQVTADSNVTLVTAPASTPASVMVQGERPATERLPFRAGVSTVTVEKLGQAVGCVGGQGAGLMTPQGPVELYRMRCDSGQVFMAKCELRQCRIVSATPAGGYGAMTVDAAHGVRQELRRSEVPALVLDWRCGRCVPNANFAAALRGAYAAEAGRYGMSVSGAATTIVSVVEFNKHIFPMKNTVGLNAAFGRQSVSVQESTTAFSGMDFLADVSAKKLFQALRGKSY
ncbi:hypothetical protein [Massilia sp. TSP1-1-2]|uniref:hypothetical protein n=1 Tax=Massilia sp. TSP1-1-2 TaxID=2804649 RepID=UPI003CF95055